MALETPKSMSVTEQGEPDGWSPKPGFNREMDPRGQTRLVISVPTSHLLDLHQKLTAALQEPVGMLYRKVVDRQAEKELKPSRDYVALEMSADAASGALATYTDLLHHDARCELWLRDSLHAQVVLDADGLLYCYPDDPTFEDVLLANGLAPEVGQTILERDYARHCYHAECDDVEAAFLHDLRLVEVPPQR